ncbi:MAG: thioredoxin family protein [Clostridiales bacterium]|nr:thioredoxin family protein [Clostridiales bacterium]
MAKRWTEADFDTEVLNSDKLAIVDFYSDSCLPCKAISPLLAELEESYAGQVLVGKVNAVYERGLVFHWEVASVPTILFLKNGKEVARFSGVQRKDDLVREIENNIS